jgi:hypothetical protein
MAERSLRVERRRRAIAAVLAWSLSVWGAPEPAEAAAPGDARPGGAGPDGAGRSAMAEGPAAAPAGDILLNVGAIATGSPEAEALRAAAGSFDGRRLHLVQFAGPIRPEWYATLEATGVEVVQFVPSFAYLVYGDAAAIGRVQALAQSSSSVRWDGAYLARHKVQPAAQAAARAKLGLAATEDSFAIQLVADPEANAETLKLVGALARGSVRQDWGILKYRNVVVTLPVDAVDAIAARPDVVSIDRHVRPELFDERQDRILTGQLTGNSPSPGDHLAYLAAKGFAQAQFDASGFVVDVTDSGIDNGTTTPNHFGLRAGGSLAGASRVRYNRLVGTPSSGVIQGCDGHGTLNAHVVAGYVPDPATLPVPAAHRDGSGYRYGLGVCPFVRVGSSVIFDPGYTEPNLPNLQSRAYGDNARVSTNSWGANAGGAYTVEAQTFDALVRDAQPAGAVIPATGNQQMVVVFSAGNAGPNLNTVGTPGVAKNVITVGASEGVQAFGGADGCGMPDAGADSANDMAGFSSRGPTDDGRFKPDVVAPGTHISGGVFQAAASVAGTGAASGCFDGTGVCGGVGGSLFFPSVQQFYTASTGTSHSAPAVAGAAALLRQRFINDGLAPPSPAMTKALLVNSARHLTGIGADDTLPSNSQGMGRANLDESLSQLSGPRVLLDQRVVDVFTASGQQRAVTGVVASSGQPFRVTLAWTDAPGATSGATYVNNLDLEVSVGGQLYRGNVFSGGTSAPGGTADARNNVESVFLPAGLSGAFAVRVVARNVAGDGVPGNGTPLDQDFALVVSNAEETPQAVVVAGAATVVADSCSGTGELDPGEIATVSLCLQNAGTLDTTSAVATLLETGGVTTSSGAQAYGVIPAGGAAVCRSFHLVADGLACGESLTATVRVEDGLVDLGEPSWTLATGAPVVAAAQAFDGVTAPTLPAGWATSSQAGLYSWTTVSGSADSPPNAAHATDPPVVSLTSLESPDIAVPATPAAITLTFRHSYSLESGYDGGVLELKVGAGAFQDVVSAGGAFAAGGYNSELSTEYENPLGGRQAWTGPSGGYVTTTVHLPASVSGQTIRLRWRLGSDNSVGAAGWSVDSISLRAGSTCCTSPTPYLLVDDVSVAEGDAGTTMASFTVSLWPASAGTVSVQCATADGTATTADADYVAESRTLTFDPGVTSQPFTVTVNGDTTIEASETFTVSLGGATGAPIWDGQGTGTIRDDDAPVPCTGFSIAPTSASAGPAAGSQIVTITGSPAGCETGDWTATGNGSWLTVAPSSGTGSGSTTVSWTENTGLVRAGTATIAGDTFTVTQASPPTEYFTVLPPCRLVDTRQPGPSSGALAFGTSRTFTVVGGACAAVPASATAVAFNATVTGATAAGNCRLYPGPETPQVSTINFAAGQTRANNAIVPLGAGGTVTALCSGGAPGTVHLVLDVSGYFE